MEQSNPNLSTDFVKDMLAESPAKEPKAVVADRIPKLPKNGWVAKVDKDRFRKTALGLQICNQMMKVAL